MRNLLFAALVASLLLFGCAGQSSQPAGQIQQQNQPAAIGQQPSAGNQPSSGAQPSSGPSAQAQTQGESAADAFASIIGMKKTLQYKVAYDVTSDVAGQRESSQMTQYLKGANKLRIDSSYEGIESRTYLVDGVYYSCSNQAGWTCIKFDVPKDDASSALDDVADNKQDYSVMADGTMQVAGVTATCYKITGKNIESSRSCHSPEGVPLYAKVATSMLGGKAETEMRATSYSNSVPDSDFVVPAAATELPTAAPGNSGANGGMDACAYCNYVTGSDKEECLASCGG